MEEVVHEYDGTACHPGEANANFMKEDVYECDLNDDYRGKGNTNKMDEKDDQWTEEYRPVFVEALKGRIAEGP
jgi:hypothetical protein